MLWFPTTIIGWFCLLISRKEFSVFFLILLIFLSVFRYYVGSDFDDYVSLYDNAVLGVSIPVERSFSIFSKIFGFLGFNFQTIIIFYGFVTYLLIYKGVSSLSNNHIFFAAFVFLFYLVFYFPSFSIVRQCLASAIAFFGFAKYLIKGKRLSFFYCVIFAVLIHYSSVIYLLCYLFVRGRLSPFQYIIILFFVVCFSLTSFVNTLNWVVDFTGFEYKNYSFSGTELPPLSFIFNTIILFVLFVFSLTVIKKSKLATFLVNMLFFMLMIRILALNFLPITRLASSFFVFVPVLFCVFYCSIPKTFRALILFLLLPLALLNDYVRSQKDYSYYHYAINFCLIGDHVCPIPIVGDLPLEDLLIPEVLR